MKDSKIRKSGPVQSLLAECSRRTDSREEFMMELCYAMVATNIPFHKLQSTPFKSFLEKYTNKQIPDESTLRKNYLNICFNSTMSEIRKKIQGHFIYIMVDETTDPRGKYICSLVIGILHPEVLPTPFLISVKELVKTNHETVSRFINDSLMNFFEETTFQDKILLFITDAAPYMVKTGTTLKVFHSKMIHLTCMAHALNRVAEKIREVFPDVNKLINNGKKIFLKAPHHVSVYRDKMDCPLPPEPVITRWGTWLEAALFYSDNFSKYKEVIAELEEDAQSVTKVKAILKTTSITSDLAFIRAHYSTLSDSIKKLEERNLSLSSQIEIIEKTENQLKIINNEKGLLIYNKFKNVIEKIRITIL